MDEDVAAFVLGDEAEALFGVVPLDLAGGHSNLDRISGVRDLHSVMPYGPVHGRGGRRGSATGPGDALRRAVAGGGSLPGLVEQTISAPTWSSSLAPVKGARRWCPRSSSVSWAGAWESASRSLYWSRSIRPSDAGRPTRRCSNSCSRAWHKASGSTSYRDRSATTESAGGPRRPSRRGVIWLDALTVNVDRSWRNPNLLVWHREMWAVDHGAALLFQHTWPSIEAFSSRPYRSASTRSHRLPRRSRRPRRSSRRS